MKDIARDLGVSLMTVSKALRSHNDISEATRRRVQQRARELDYQPNWVAQSLVTRRTYLIGLVIPDLMHSFFAEVAQGVARKFEPLGYQVVISNSEENPAAEARQLELLLNRKVDGLIVASAQTCNDVESFERIRRRGIPLVLIDRLPPSFQGHFVGGRDEEVGRLATAHLIEQGCRRIAHIRGPAVGTGLGRLSGYSKALSDAGLRMPENYVVTGLHDDIRGYEAMRQLLQIHPRPDGVFCYNDPVAAGAIRAILQAGLSIPRDIAIVGAGNVHYSDLLKVPLSTVDQSSTEIGDSAASLLMECIEAKAEVPARSIRITPRLIVRESSLRNGQ